MKFPLLLSGLLAAAIGATSFAAEVVEADVVVFGGTAGGVSAACTTVRLGKSVVLTEFGTHIGGLTSGGLGFTDIGNKAAIGGFARAFYQRLGTHYGKPEAWTFAPGVAEENLRALLKEAKVPIYFQQRLASVKKDGAQIVEITMENGNVFRGKMFIDCTYEGDLMARAGVEYMVGREANARFGETLNGVRAETPKHQFKVPVDPYLTPGDPQSGLLPFIQPGDGGTPGEGDRAVQAYNFRLCLTKNPKNRRPIEPPPGYEPARYELLGRYLQALIASGHQPKLAEFLKLDMVTEDKTDVNNQGGFSTDYIGANYEYPEASYDKRAQIWQEHEHYIRGFLTFLATDARVPEPMRQEMQEWGLCKDEFEDTGGWPHAMYVREARRMLGGYVMTEKNCRGAEVAQDAVGLGAYNMDSHNCQRIVKNGRVENEGDVQVPVKPYPISYRSIVPPAEKCENLFVPVALSATHIAYGSIRMEPVFMILGQSAATAASLAIDGGTAVQAVDYAKLRTQLLADRQVLEWSAPTAEAAAGAAPPTKLEGIVQDDSEAEKTGEWQQGQLAGTQHVGAGYLHDGDAHKGAISIRWRRTLEAGDYEILLHFPANANRATNVPVLVEQRTVNGGGAALKMSVNQRSSAEGVESLGRVSVPAGTTLQITISNEGTDGHVIADGVQLLKR